MSIACTVPPSQFDDHERLYGLARTAGADPSPTAAFEHRQARPLRGKQGGVIFDDAAFDKTDPPQLRR